MKIIIAACFILFGFSLLVLGVLILVKSYIDLKRIWLTRREKAYRPILAAWMEGEPGNYAARLRPRLWGDPIVLENLLNRTISRLTGPLRMQAIQMAEGAGLVEHRLMQLRKSRRPFRMAYLADRLGLLGSRQAIAQLSELVQNPNAEIRFVAARSLSRIGDPDTLPTLVQLITAEPDGTVGRYADILRQFGTPITQALGPVLQSESPFKRRMLVMVLGEVRDPAAADLIGPLLQHDPDPLVREASAQALAKMEALDWSAAIIEALGDSAASVRAAAAESLGCVPDPAAVAPLSHAVLDPSWIVRTRAARALLAQGDPGREALRKSLPVVHDKMRPLLEDLLQR